MAIQPSGSKRPSAGLLVVSYSGSKFDCVVFTQGVFIPKKKNTTRELIYITQRHVSDRLYRFGGPHARI